MDRQKLFTNMVTILNGKGRAMSPAAPGRGDPVCVYFPKDHPGCGMGCQPGFREKFGPDSDNSIGEGLPIGPHLKRRAAVREFFGVDSGSNKIHDEGFLSALQIHHDQEESWDDENPLFFDADLLAQFAADYDLEVPETA